MPSSHKSYDNNPIENKILRIVEKTIKNYKMFDPQDSVLIGVSGGPDSVALLYVLLESLQDFRLHWVLHT